MNQNTRIALTGLLSAVGGFINALAAEIVGGAVEPSAPADAPTTPKKTSKKEKPAPAVEEKAAETTAPAEEPAADEGAEGKTYEELRAIIAGPVKDGQGPEVKKIIAKYDPDSNPPSLKTMPAKNHAAFEKDIQALSY